MRLRSVSDLTAWPASSRRLSWVSNLAARAAISRGFKGNDGWLVDAYLVCRRAALEPVPTDESQCQRDEYRGEPRNRSSRHSAHVLSELHLLYLMSSNACVNRHRRTACRRRHHENYGVSYWLLGV